MANYTILLVDYEPRSIERTSRPLREAGYHIEVAKDGITAIEMFGRVNPDLVLVEAMIPKKHGFEVCQTLKQTPEGKQTPILIVTGVYRGRKYRSQALHLYGCDEYLEKPISDESLLAAVNSFLDGKAPRNAGEAEPAAAASAATPPAGPSPAVPSASGADDRGDGVLGGFSEEEILARLDAIMPDDESAAPPSDTTAKSAAK